MYERYLNYTQKVYIFAKKWLEKFCNSQADEMEFTEYYMADDCRALEFIMDSGKAFEEKYGLAASSYDELKEVINKIDNIELLGSAIYSRWRYFNHWAMGGESILEFKNRAWFITALNRLIELTEDNLFGRLTKVKIVSDGLRYGPMPEPDEEVEQSLTIRADGRVWLYGYNYEIYRENNNKASRRVYLKIESDIAKKILRLIAKHFTLHSEEILVTDVGSWNAYLTNDAGEVFDFWGCLYGDIEVDGIYLSEFIRETVGIKELFLFGGCWDYEKIDKIVVNYNRESKIKPQIYAPDKLSEYITEFRSEKLIVDRQNGLIEYIQEISPGEKVVYSNKNIKQVVDFIDIFYQDGLFDDVEEEQEEQVENLLENINYSITLDYAKSPQRVISGIYDVEGLPYDWENFVKHLLKLMKDCDKGEMFNPAFYKRERRKEGQYIFCSVTFNRGGKSYYYLTEDDSIKVGDFVVVPVGYEKRREVVRVARIEYFYKDEAPYPIESTKKIIEKYKK